MLSLNGQSQHTYLDTAWAVQAPYFSEAIYHSSSIVNQGKLIVTGNVETGGDIDVVTVKYKSNGDTLWMKTQSGSLTNGADYGVDLAVNSAGDVIVIAAIENSSTAYDYAIYQYDGNTGTLDWSYSWDGIGGGNDIPTALELDAYGNIYVAGGSEASGGFSDFGIIKLSSAGSLLWTTYYDYANLHDAASEIVINSQIFVTGISAGGVGDWDLATIRLNPITGALGTINRTDIAGATMVEASAMVTDSLNNMYITGFAEVAGDKNIQTIKLDSNLNEVWIRNYDGGFNDLGSDLVVDNTGNVYVTGVTGKSSILNQALTVKYDSAGDLVWMREFGNIESSVGGRGEKITLNEENDVFITGTIADASNISSLFFTQYSSTGQVLLSTEFNSLGIGDTAYNIHVIADSVYITGLSNYVGSVQMTAVKYVMLHEVDYAYFYLNGEESVWCQQPGMYSFALSDSSLYEAFDSSIVSAVQFFPEGIHYVYFNPEASETAIDSMITVIEGHTDFYKEYLVATQTRNNTKKHEEELYAGIDDFIEIVFNDPDLTDSQVDSFALSKQLDAVYYPPVGIDGGVFIFKANQNYTKHSLTSATLTMNIAADLWEEDSLEFIQLVTPSLRLFRPDDPDDPFYGDMWWAEGNVIGCNGTTTLASANIGLDCAWNLDGEFGDGYPYSGEGVVVAVIDYHGVQWDHPDLDGSFIDGWVAFGLEEDDVSVIPIYSAGSNVYHVAWNEAHLQNVSGIISADVDNNEGVAGVAYNSKIMPCLWTGTSAQLNALALRLILEEEPREVDIINMSFGYEGMTLAEAYGTSFFYSLQQCYDYGRDGKGIILVASAGNDNGEVIQIPAAIPFVFSVSASNPNDQLKAELDGFDPVEGNWGSSYFNKLDVAAPGICIMSTDFSDDGTETGFPELEGNGYGVGDYYSFSGTSAAAPIVSGIAALILEKDPTLTAAEVYDIIRYSSEKVGGYSYSSMEPDGKSLQMGYGRVNACAALDFVGEVLTDEEIDKVNGFLYNNPVTDYLTLNLDNSSNYSVTLMSLDGQLVFSETFIDISSLIIDMQSLSNGLFFLTFIDELTQKTVTVKVIKI